jgi:hypothetical protein
MAVFADGKIEAYVGPPRLGAADDLEAVIIDFSTRRALQPRIAVQELDSEPIARAILHASWRGVHVELFLAQDYLRTSLKREREPASPSSRRPSQARRPSRRWSGCNGDPTPPT